MGTNFYAQHIPSKEEKQKLQEFMDNDDFTGLQDYLIEVNKRYHIGKRSGGWQFLFAIQDCDGPMPWTDSIDSISEYLSRQDVKIVDEYGEEFTFEQFWNDEVGEALYNDPEKYINTEQYYAKYPNLYYRFDNNEYTSQEGLRFCKDWFC